MLDKCVSKPSVWSFLQEIHNLASLYTTKHQPITIGQRRCVDGPVLQGFACVWIISCNSFLPEQLIFTPFLFKTGFAFSIK